MAQGLKNKKILILGGTGLVGKNTVTVLLDQKVKNIGVVGLKNDKNWKFIEKIERDKKVKIKKYKNNLLWPSWFSQSSFKKNTKQSNVQLKNFLASDIKKDEVKKEPLYKIILDFCPDYIIDSINTPTQCSYAKFSSSIIEGIGMGSLLLLRYYKILYHLLSYDFWKKERKKINISQYIKIGTTGIGGMGLDIPFTHGEEKPSLSLLKKVALAGSQTNILFAMRNSHRIANIQEIIPTTSVFQLTDFNTSHKEIDGGESQGYALEEFRLLTNQSQMGVIDAHELAEIIIKALQKGKSPYNTLEALAQSGVACSDKSLKMRSRILDSWWQKQNKSAKVSVAHGNLGPKRTRKLLFELFILLDYYRVNRKDFWRLSPRKIQKQIKDKISKNSSLKEEIRLADMRVLTSPPKKPSDKYIDLSTKNITKWRKALQSLGLEKKDIPAQAGDILSQLIKKYHELKHIP
ncbi:MAG: hypothetical protein U5L76_00810 [Patescibacteria group bacterium]|nr:hypothetical protein [Patescibacteria group bacterium]